MSLKLKKLLNGVSVFPRQDHISVLLTAKLPADTKIKLPPIKDKIIFFMIYSFKLMLIYHLYRYFSFKYNIELTISYVLLYPEIPLPFFQLLL